MPKRKCPFGDSAPLQLKTHVGFKEVATASDMQKVYERTRELLFQGANRSGYSHETNGHSHSHSSAGPPLNGHSLEHNGTSHAANGYSSTHNGHSHTHNGSPQMAGKQPATETCTSCRNQLKSAVPCCSCDRFVCEGCLQKCCVCQESFCQFCSVLNYDVAEVRVFCFNCLPVLL